MKVLKRDDTICALATAGGNGPIAVLRLSGKEAIKICNSCFSKKIINVKTHTLHFGTIKENEEDIDEAVISIFRNPNSYTGEDVVEVSCHGSNYIQNRILQLFIKKGARLAEPGEFTMRAFQNGKMDLTQAESVADLIAAENKSAHQTALTQLRGGFTEELKELRSKLIDFASLIELELDFSEEDVEFANRKELLTLLKSIQKRLNKLVNSFALGNVIKNGIPVTILGPPNTGKSTLLNRLLNEEKAIVSNIPGTTRDIIEDKLVINGVSLRFIDTAGLRKSEDEIENIGIERAKGKAKESDIVLYLIDATKNINMQVEEMKKLKDVKTLIAVVNKIDINKNINKEKKQKEFIFISAKENLGIDILKEKIIQSIDRERLSNNHTIITNARHFNELKLSVNEIDQVIKGIKNNISSDFLSINIRQALFHLGSITGEVSTDDLLANIFGKFCIGK